MDSRKQRHYIKEGKGIDIVEYLSGLRYKSAKIRNADYRYCSPFRNEKTPSFKINRKLNCWYDHGPGKGGAIIDFGIQFYGGSVSEFLQKLSEVFSFHQPIIQPAETTEKKSKLIILQSQRLTSISLLRYQEQRKIPLDIAREFCSEVRFKLEDKIYFGIDFKNDSGGYEIRNPSFKSSQKKNLGQKIR